MTKKIKGIKLNFSNIVFALGILFILIPTTVIGVILIQSSMQTGNVIAGNRFANDLNPAITEDLQNLGKEAMQSVSGVEVVELNLKAATLRLTVTLPAGKDEANYLSLIENSLSKLNEAIPFDTYFNDTDSMKMYDLEVNYVDALDNTKSIYYQVIKNANMDTWRVQNLLVPVNPELAAELLAKLAQTDENSVIPNANGSEESETTEESGDE
ncbi:MAG TPA: hypothetical protein DIC19_05125 [Erysipelotrichaceae bacterium]|nr:hypothetical protein [Erysipelotrichaceae bacterium]